MKIAITFLLLGLVGSASSILGPHLPVTNAAPLADLIARVLISCDRAWRPDSEKSNDQILEDVTGVLNSLRALVLRLLELLGCTLDELLDEMNMDDELKGPLIEGCKTGVWTDLISTYGESFQLMISLTIEIVFNRVVK
ncbi:uncharacterized protein O3C94_001786 [Discoglossus pictus]